jgi:hypothetical protein
MEPNGIGIRPKKLPPHLDDYKEADRALLTGSASLLRRRLFAGALDNLDF